MKAMSIKIFLILSLFAVINPSLLPAATQQRIALVIGNSQYTYSPLKNPVNDATDVATALKSLGFDVILKTNATKREMGSALEEFAKQLKGRDVGLFYYAGHGVQLNGVNYLIPVSAKINEETDVEYEAIDAGRILATMYNAKSRVNIVILDACRDNPYVRSFRSTTRGLAIITKAPMGTIVSYSTSPGDVARDGKDRNSPYTTFLIKYMKEPGLSIEQVFKSVRQKLNKETNGKQIPWELSSLQGDFFFVPGSSGKSDAIIPTEKTTTAGDDLDDENSKLDAEKQRLEKERAALAKKKTIDEKRQQIEEEQEILEAEKETQRLAEIKRKVPGKSATIAKMTRPSASTANEIRRDGRFISYDDGTVLDTRTKLMWAAKDNGSDINWLGAKSYCVNYRGGGYTDWRMPTQDEFAVLYDKAETNNFVGILNVHLTELIHLTSIAPWASETSGSEAAFFLFND